MPGNDPVANLGGSGAALALAQAGQAAQSRKGYSGMGIDSGQPGVYAVPGQMLGTGISAALTANRAHLTRFVAPRSMTIKQIAFGLTAAATVDDQIDLGIYAAVNGPLPLLGSMGATNGLTTGALGRRVGTLVTPVNLVSGQVYFAALAYGAVGGTGAQFACVNIRPEIQSLFGAQASTFELGFANSAFPLPASLAFGAGITNVPILALLQ